ncbi:MAG TPA: aspartate aminotransferase family protein [Beijerinckiaceae bacterium]|nr:aspartate aminotransferase family protein [Beijerinckiaceae bacterium]
MTATSALLPTYARADLAFERGEGVWLETREGERYLDFGAGIAVNVLGHAHPHLVAALTAQANKVWHTSNLVRMPEGERLAQRLVDNTFADFVFFGNSGAEANEAAIKIARKHHAANGQPERYRIVSFEGAFHGRTLATLAAGGQQKYIEGFGPKVEGFDQVPPEDLEALKKAIGPETAALMVEPVQGEGGVRPLSPGFLRALRALCDEHGLMLIFDEIQTGVGRTGKLFAYEWSGITPDIMSVAKGIGGGFPMGACLATAEAAKGMTAGTHGSTFGGNPLAMAVGNAVLDVVLEPGFLERVERMGLVFKQRLAELKDRHPAVIAEIRGSGLLLGLRTIVPNTDVVAAARDEKLFILTAGDNVVRLAPPLTVTEGDVAEAIERLDRACTAVERDLAAGAAKTGAAKAGAAG